MKRIICLAVFSLAPGLALAQEASGCDKFKWPVEREQAALAQAHAVVETGGALAVGTPVIAHLGAIGATKFASPPERQPAPDTFAAALTFSPSAGVYTVSLSAPGWIDLLQDGAPIKPLAFSGVRDCPNIRKVLKYQFEAKPTTIQVSNAKEASIAIVVLPDAR